MTQDKILLSRDCDSYENLQPAALEGSLSLLQTYHVRPLSYMKSQEAWIKEKSNYL